MSEIRRIRRSKDITQAQLAKAVGVSQIYISMIETGKNNGSIKTMMKIADALGVTVDRLIRKEA